MGVGEGETHIFKTFFHEKSLFICKLCLLS